MLQRNVHCYSVCAEEHRKELKAAHDRELQAKALVAMNSQLRPWAMMGQNKHT